MNDPLLHWPWFRQGLIRYTAATGTIPSAVERQSHPFVEECLRIGRPIAPLVTLALLEGDLAWGLTLNRLVGRGPGPVPEALPTTSALARNYQIRSAWWKVARHPTEGWLDGLVLSAFAYVDDNVPPLDGTVFVLGRNGWVPKQGGASAWLNLPLADVETQARQLLLSWAQEKGRFLPPTGNGHAGAEATVGALAHMGRVVRTTDGFFVLPEAGALVCSTVPRGLRHAHLILFGELDEVRAVGYERHTAYDILDP